MQQRISIREANQHLSRYLDAVENGDEVVITRRGKPVARLVAVEEGGITPEQEAARKRQLQRMSKGISLGGLQVDRDELHER